MRQKKIPKPLYINGFRTYLAGAEGLEPSARGFGVLPSSLKNKGFEAFDDTLTTPYLNLLIIAVNLSYFRPLFNYSNSGISIPIFSIRSPRDLSYCAREMALRSRNKSSVRFCRRKRSIFFSSGVNKE